MIISNESYPPCLLQRLLDDEPRTSTESARGKFDYDERRMHAIIKENITDILNTVNSEKAVNRERYPHPAASVVNFGIAAMVGEYSMAQRWCQHEQQIREAIIRFEPRIAAETLVIALLGDIQSPACNGIIHFEIRAIVQLSSYSFGLRLNAHYDIENESAVIK
ncbi:type VI secretion system baseplate subunit TssE [Rosenbergiella epipactidis]|uniref:type VI secretion system baseplate subunit TssE n=1 Tax=Rosenbergiella epipactidis TaxID=1544694 RepID=UPI001F4DE859|nr:GPW/gp25 family protein [Rosenbergiella epipactidis]